MVAVFRYICVMIKKLLSITLICTCCLYSNAQVDTTFVDSKSLDDQFYIGFNYNVLLEQPELFEQSGLSGGIEIGYIRDIPINKKRNIGFGIGIGYAYNSYIQNLKISETGDVILFEIVESKNYIKNRFTTHLIELPIEFRWRTSTPTKYSFWRIYGGFKFGYVFYNSSIYEDAIETIKLKNINPIDKLQYGLTLSAGYSSLNLHLYYSLKGLFKDANVNNEPIDLKQLSIGLIFYML